jgi:hypothetical protein
LSRVDLRAICDRAAEEIRPDAQARGGDVEVRGEFGALDGDEVLLLADRAYGRPDFIDLVDALNWHYVIRLQSQTLIKCSDDTVEAARTFAPRAGSVWCSGVNPDSWPTAVARSAEAMTVFAVMTAALFVGSSLLWSMKAPPVLAGVSIFGAAGYLFAAYLGWRLLRAIKKSGDINSRK